jgi:hypothetical protein
MTQLAVKRFLPTKLILNLSTVATSLISSLELLIGLVNLVRGTLLPFFDRLFAGLALGFLG